MEQKLNNIVLVPTDFSEICQNAINHGAEIAVFLGFKLSILHVINSEAKAQMKKDNLTNADIEKKLQELTKDAEDNFNIQADYILKEGSIFDIIHNVAGEIGANIMVMGTHGKKGLQYVFGSHALKIITKSPVPTVVVQKRGFDDGYNKIVFPINEFTEARQQVQWALFMANSFKAKIYIFRQPSKNSDIVNKLEVVSKQIENIFNEKNVDFEMTMAEKPGQFAKQLISFAAGIHADMVMIMTDADIFSPDFPAGQWDETMMFNEAQIPVMCINPVETGKVFYDKLGMGY